MTEHLSHTGVCVIRLEREETRVLVSLRLSEDISERSGEREQRFADIEEALRVVRSFVESFAELPRSP